MREKECKAPSMAIHDWVRRLVDTLGAPFGNSLIVAPTNTITPETPFENIKALFNACYDGVSS